MSPVLPRLARTAALALLCGACGRAEAAAPRSRLAMDHGLAPGTRIEATPVRCLTGKGRTLAAPDETQIVTFATPYDCSACTPHLAGVPRVVKELGLKDHAFMVIWTPRPRSLEHDLGPSRPDLPICLNGDGSLWERYDLLHTPFTVVIRGGRVVYMNDGTLLTRRHQVELAGDLKKAFAAP